MKTMQPIWATASCAEMNDTGTLRNRWANSVQRADNIYQLAEHEIDFASVTAHAGRTPVSSTYYANSSPTHRCSPAASASIA